ncbi:DNA-binding protein [Vibrio amylolyticus]|uniref:baseplate complex protein n=1 Tax=Vibrio amylolyticus TaxID=2847292 RepID=UPI003553E909
MKMLSLDGELLPLQNLKVNCSKQFKAKDMSGQSSSTASSEQGEKGVKVDVSGTIAFKNEDHLTRLYELFSMKQDNGDRKIFRIGNRDAKLYKIREVKFEGKLSSESHERLLAWVISFSLREQNSAAEQKEIRAREQSSPAQTENNAHAQALKDADEALN